MSPFFYFLIAGIIICLFILFGGVKKAIHWLTILVTRFFMGIFALFFINVLGSLFAYHLPINLFTAIVSGLLGIPGVIVLFLIDYIII